MLINAFLAFKVIIYTKMNRVDYVSMGILFRIKIVLNVILNVKHVMDQLLIIAFLALKIITYMRINRAIIFVQITFILNQSIV